MTDEVVSKWTTHGLTHNVQTLLVSENGSKAWGYDSVLSDFDVKAIFIRPYQEYLTVTHRQDRDVIEYQADPMHSYTGWDVRKVLNLLWKGNAQVYEMFWSPKVYYKSDAVLPLQSFAWDVLNESLFHVAYHYYGLAHRTYQERIREVGEPTLKKYLYVLRPLLSVDQMLRKSRLPMLDFEQLLDECFNEGELHQDVYNVTWELLQDRKAGVVTGTNKLRLDVLDKYCEDKLNQYKTDPNPFGSLLGPEQSVHKTPENFNKMFRNFLDLPSGT